MITVLKLKLKKAFWSRVMSILVVLTMMSGVFGILGIGVAHADPILINPTPGKTTTGFNLYVNGEYENGGNPVDPYTATDSNGYVWGTPNSSVQFYQEVSGSVYCNYSANSSTTYTGYGFTLASILQAVDPTDFSGGITSTNCNSITVKGSDGDAVQFSYSQLFGNLYYYTSQSSYIPSSTMLAMWAGSGANNTSLDNLNTLRLFMGESSYNQNNKSEMVKWVSEIDIGASTTPQISLNKLTDSLQAGGGTYGTDTLTATTSSGNNVTWSSSNPNIVTVVGSGTGNDTGAITSGSTTGTATITASVTVNGTQYNASCVVTVASPTTTFVLKVNGNTISSAVDPTSYYLPEKTNNYSSYNGSDVYYYGEGYDLAQVLENADSNDFGNGVGSVVTAVVYGSDGYVWQDIDTAQQDLFANPNTLYYYPSSGSATSVDTIIAVDSAAGANNQSGLNTLDTLRLFMGQQLSTQDTSQGLVKWVTEIDLYTTPW